MKRSRLGWSVLLLLALAGAGGWLAYRTWWGVPPADVGGPALLEASGVIQVQQITVASEMGGTIAAVPVREGQSIGAGDSVVQLDTTLIDGEIAVAEGRLAVAEAGLRQAAAGARPGQIAVAEAQLAQAQAGYVAAARAVSDTQALVETPQYLNLEIAVTRGQLASAQAAEARATALKDATELLKGEVDRALADVGGAGRKRFLVSSGDIADLLSEHLPPELIDLLPDDIGEGLGDRTFTYGDYELHVSGGRYDLYIWKTIDIPFEAQLLPNQWWQAWVGVNAATARVAGVEAQLSHLYAQRAAPQALETQVDEARALEAEMAQQVALAQAQVDGLRAGLTVEELDVIEAQVGQARAALEVLLRRRDMLALRSPITGTIVDVLVQEAEVAAQGSALVTVADLSELTLTVYVPETRLGNVWLDQPVEVTVNGHPDLVFTGCVANIADRAEFTPRNVATEEERESLVFAVDIRIEDTDGILKPGMPAGARFLAGAGTE